MFCQPVVAMTPVANDTSTTTVPRQVSVRGSHPPVLWRPAEEGSIASSYGAALRIPRRRVKSQQDAASVRTFGAKQWRVAATPIDCSHAESG